MVNTNPSSDRAEAPSPPDERRETNSAFAEHLAADLWKEIHQLSDSARSSLNSLAENQTFQRILDSLAHAAPSPVADKKADWTIAIDFTTDFGDGQGVDSGMEKLQDFAKKTKGKNVTIVAQTAIADTDEYDLNGERVIKPDTKYKLDRYVIKDGEVKAVSSGFSNGYGQDLKDLLEYASKNHQGNRVGLIMDSHGTGNDGLMGDSGKLSVDDFVKTVQDGLKGSGHDKLDMLDFDACLMAQNGAVSKICKVADQVVASAETESIYNGQNFLDPIARIFEKPDTDGFALARDIVTQTHKDMQDWKNDGYFPSVSTLAHLNLRNYDAFRKSLDQFGDNLAEALKNKNNRAPIESAIDDSIKYGHGRSLLTSLFGEKRAGKHRTDLKEFTEKVLTAIDNGEIEDPNRDLKRAAQELMNQRSLLVDSYHGEDEYTKAGGLSVFLPGRNLRDTDKEAWMYTTAGRLCDMSKPEQFSAINKNDKSRCDFLAAAKGEVFWTRPRLFILGTKGVDPELDKVDSLLDEFSKATDNKQREDCFKRLHQASDELSKTEPFKKQHDEQAASLHQKVSQVYKISNIDDSNGWSRFRLKLRQNK